MVKPISLWENETAGAWPQFYCYLKSTTDYNQQKPTNGQRKVWLSQVGGHLNNGHPQRKKEKL